MFSWNIIGILIWVAIILYLVFIVQNIRQRRIKMIIKQHKRFTWPNFLINVVEVGNGYFKIAIVSATPTQLTGVRTITYQVQN